MRLLVDFTSLPVLDWFIFLRLDGGSKSEGAEKYSKYKHFSTVREENLQESNRKREIPALNCKNLICSVFRMLTNIRFLKLSSRFRHSIGPHRNAESESLDRFLTRYDYKTQIRFGPHGYKRCYYQAKVSFQLFFSQLK